MRDIHPSPTRQNSKPTQVPPDLATCEFVFVLVDAVRKPLQAPYAKRLGAISRKVKSFVIDRNGCKDTDGIERLEFAYVHKRPTPDDENIATPSDKLSHSHLHPASTNKAQTPSLTKSGR
ncbi:hypothetical protein CRM22_011325 [Opisthorchis felineus]|uniref:Uncharacterized protein n=1 Tax=Opisthorchis felineus TaxID=147828 RepID=A0A4S2JNB1_OPIFE|nr:hypothetical protein CRM22_011325 [Opisthorchis felineus]